MLCLGCSTPQDTMFYHATQTSHIQVSPDDRLDSSPLLNYRIYTPLRKRPGLVVVRDEYDDDVLMSTEEARQEWKSYAAKGWEWV